MKIKLSEITVDSTKIKEIHNKPKKIHSGLSKTIKPHYSIELNDGHFIIITKQEYKILKKRLGDDSNE